MGRQMAFQMNRVEFCRYFAEVLKALAGNSDPKAMVGDLIDRHTADPKKQDRLRAIFVIVTQLGQNVNNVIHVEKVIAWRTAEEGKYDLETSFGKESSKDLLKETGVLDAFDLWQEKKGASFP